LHLLSGCILGSEKPDLAIPVPEKFDGADNRPHTALPHLAWWAQFRSPELTRIIEEAREANFDIAVAVARVVQADAQSRILGAALLPAISASANGSRSQSSQGGNSFVTSGTGPRNQFSGSLSASYEIDFWGKNRAALRAAEDSAVASHFDREVVELTTIATVANAYFQILAAQDRLGVARRDLASAERILTLINQRLAAGTASTLETSQQESLVAQQRASIPLLEQTFRQSIATLAVLVGRPPEFFTVRGGSMNRIAIPRITPGLPSEVLTQRPDVRSAEAQLASANASVESARAAFFPSIQLTAQSGYQSQALVSLFRPESMFYSLAGGLTQPIFDGFRLQGQLDSQRGLQEQLLQTYRKTVVSSFADVENALTAVRQTSRREQLQRDVVTSSRRAFDIAEQRLREGTVDLVTVLSTQQSLFQAEDTLAQARLAHLLAIVSLYQALGGSWASDELRGPRVVSTKGLPTDLPTVAPQVVQ
jgi:multidrug efflux system outer membrane protein